jgi:hypothetical protein
MTAPKAIIVIETVSPYALLSQAEKDAWNNVYSAQNPYVNMDDHIDHDYYDALLCQTEEKND